MLCARCLTACRARFAACFVFAKTQSSDRDAPAALRGPLRLLSPSCPVNLTSFSGFSARDAGPCQGRHGPLSCGPVTMLKSTYVVGGSTLLSRVLGFVRDMVFAAYFGAGIGMDVFV